MYDKELHSAPVANIFPLLLYFSPPFYSLFFCSASVSSTTLSSSLICFSVSSNLQLIPSSVFFAYCVLHLFLVLLSIL